MRGLGWERGWRGHTQPRVRLCDKGAFNEEPGARAGTCLSPSHPGSKTSPAAGLGSAPAAEDIVTPLAKRSLFWSLAQHTGQGNKR